MWTTPTPLGSTKRARGAWAAAPKAHHPPLHSTISCLYDPRLPCHLRTMFCRALVSTFVHTNVFLTSLYIRIQQFTVYVIQSMASALCATPPGVLYRIAIETDIE